MFTREELINEVKKMRLFIEEKGNDCDGTVELLEDHLSCLIDDLKEELRKVNDEISNTDDNLYLEFLFAERKEIESAIYDL